MTESEATAFVTAFAKAWATRDGQRFVDLWHPNGLLHYPPAPRPIKGAELAEWNDLNAKVMPDMSWDLHSWTWRGDIVMIEFHGSGTVNGKRLFWKGIDKFTMREGRIDEEIVFLDTHPYWIAIDPSMDRGALMRL